MRAKCQTKVRLVAAWARQHPDERLVLQGYLDEGERGAQRTGLAVQRASAVRQALMRAGVEPDRIDVVDETRFASVCRDRSERCRELNRRVEILPHRDATRSGVAQVALGP